MCKLKGLKWIKSDRTRELTIPYNVKKNKKKKIYKVCWKKKKKEEKHKKKKN